MNKKPTTSNIIQRLFFIGMKFRTWFILALIISIVLAIVSVYRPILTQQIVDIDILKLKDNNVLMKDIYFLIGLVVAETILNFFLVFLSNYIAQNVIRDIRERLYHKLIYFKTSSMILLTFSSAFSAVFEVLSSFKSFFCSSLIFSKLIFSSILKNFKNLFISRK